MNWANVLENALGNGLSDLLIGSIITILVTRFFEKLNAKNKALGALVTIDGEIQLNKHILEDCLLLMIPEFEKEMKRGEKDAISLDDETFIDAAKFIRIPIEGMLYEAFRSNYVALGTMNNVDLVEKIINLFTVEYHYKIQTSFRMEQLNWPLLDNIKQKLAEKIKLSTEISNEIVNEIKIQKKRSILLEAIFFR